MRTNNSYWMLQPNFPLSHHRFMKSLVQNTHKLYISLLWKCSLQWRDSAVQYNVTIAYITSAQCVFMWNISTHYSTLTSTSLKGQGVDLLWHFLLHLVVKCFKLKIKGHKSCIKTTVQLQGTGQSFENITHIFSEMYCYYDHMIVFKINDWWLTVAEHSLMCRLVRKQHRCSASLRSVC